jgi:hypothetical protein
MPRVKAGDVEPATAQLVHQPWCHGPGFDADAGLVSVSLHRPFDLFRV